MIRNIGNIIGKLSKHKKIIFEAEPVSKINCQFHLQEMQEKIRNKKNNVEYY